MITETTTEQQVNIVEDQHFVSAAERSGLIDDSRIGMGSNHLSRQIASVTHENPYSAIDILKNPVLIDSFTWAETDAINTTKNEYQIPGVFASIDSFHKALLGIYTYFQPTVYLKFKLNSTRFHQGLLMCTYDPFRQHMTLDDPAILDSVSIKQLTPTAMTCLPHVSLDASKSNEAELEIPWEHVQAILTTNSSDLVDLMGVARVSVFNPLLAATGTSPSVGVQVFLGCRDIALHVPIFPHPALIPGVEASGTYLGPDSADDDSYFGVREVTSQGSKEGSVIGQVAEGAANAAVSGYSAVWNFISGNWGAAAKSAGDFLTKGVGGILGAFNLDKPHSPTVASADCSIYPVEPLGHNEGISRAINLGATPVTNYVGHEAYTSAQSDELDMKKLASRYSAIAVNQPWTTTDPAGECIAIIPVMPRYVPIKQSHWASADVGSTDIGTYQVQNTWLSYVSSLYSYWGGSIKYKVQFISSDFQTGRVAAVFVPNETFQTFSVTPVPPMSAAMQAPLELMDLKEKKEFEFVVPFQSSTPRKIVIPYTPLIGGTPTTDFIYDERFTLGNIYIYVTNPLVAPNNVAPSVAFNIYAAAGDDFFLEYPSLSNRSYCSLQTFGGPSLQVETREVQVQGDFMEEERKSDSSGPVLTKGSSYTPSVVSLGQQVRDARALAKRMTYMVELIDTPITPPTNLKTQGISNANIAADFIKTRTIPVSIGPNWLRQGWQWGPGFVPPGLPNQSDISTGQIWLLAIARMYAVWSGSIVYTVVPDTSRTSPFKMYISKSVNNSTITMADQTQGNNWALEQNYIKKFTHNPTAMTNLSQQCALTVNAPYTSIFNQSLVETDWTKTHFRYEAFATGVVNITFTAPAISNSIKYEVLVRGGDDIRFGYPTAPPITYEYVKPNIINVNL